MGTAIALFTRDLRVRDNPVLDAATTGTEHIVPAFVFDRWMLAHTAHGRPNRFGFLCQSLLDLDDSLRDRGGRLIVRRGDWVQEVVQLAYESRASVIHIARDVSAYAQRRILRLRAAAAVSGVEVVEHDALTVIPPDAFGKAFVIFTPYSRRWFNVTWRELARVPRRISVPELLESARIPDASPPGEWVGGETAARQRPPHLSPYLHFGCVSPVELASRMWERPDSHQFLRNLCWRDFFAQLLHARPEVAHIDVRAGERKWIDDPDALAAWKEGRTGVALVDAAMRQLLAEGWMPNRVRMITASFLTKELRIDWRVGAAHFMDHLVDGDVASNQLNWQWVAGTGTDQRPNRHFNFDVQAKKFDPDGSYRDRWLS